MGSRRKRKNLHSEKKREEKIIQETEAGREARNRTGTLMLRTSHRTSAAARSQLLVSTERNGQVDGEPACFIPGASWAQVQTRWPSVLTYFVIFLSQR
jgi:hypothetical protein